MFTVEPCYRIGDYKEVYPNGVYIPTRSQKLKSKKLRSNRKKRGKR